MGSHEGRSDQAPRSLSDAAGVRQGHDAADADLRRQRESKVAALGGRPDTPLQNPRVRGLEIPRAARHHGGEVRLERGDAEVASLQSQSLADMVAVNTPFTRELSLNARASATTPRSLFSTRSTGPVARYLIRKRRAVRATRPIDPRGLLSQTECIFVR